MLISQDDYTHFKNNKHDDGNNDDDTNDENVDEV